jgi:hypothetical protein
MNAFSATMSVCETYFIASPEAAIAASSASMRWSEYVEM